MIQLTDQMREYIDNALANGMPCILATASRSGQPNMSYRGSVLVFDNESLALAEGRFPAAEPPASGSES